MEISTQFAILVPIIVALTQIIKVSGLATKFVPLSALLLGVIGAFLIGGVHSAVILQGIIAGLTACGLFSGLKATVA